MFQNWVAAYDWAKTRQKELLEEARLARMAKALRTHARQTVLGAPKAVLCRDCPPQDAPEGAAQRRLA
jgi:hypothetical protein